MDHQDCDRCGAMRFIICSECNGSRKGATKNMFGTFLKCSVCNENGLMPCPECNAVEYNAKMANAAKMQVKECVPD